MKYIKYLLIILVVTCITSAIGVFAANDPYYFSAMVPKFNGNVKTDGRQKQELTTQEIRYVNIPTGDPLDVILRQPTGAHMSPWYVLNHGKDIIYSNDKAMWIGSYYQLYIDSAVLRTWDTFVSLQWYIH